MDPNHRNKVNIKSPLPGFLTQWARLVNIELFSSRQKEKYELVFENQRLQLNWLEDGKFLPLYAQPPKKQRVTSANLLFKAIGRKTSMVHDLTAGLGVDAMTIAAFEKKVYCVERCAPVAMLFYDGLKRSPAKIANKIKLSFADSRRWLQQNETDLETVYIDAMFANKKRTAKSVKSMQILRALAGNDEDAEQLFNQALYSGAKRVVVKHADKAPAFSCKPTTQYLGKTIRFDVYVVN